MIFVTLGSQKFQFNRLLKAIDDLVERGGLKDKLFAQIGYSDYKPINFNYTKFLDRNEFAMKMKEADIVITHGGTGAIINAVKQGKKVVAVPRLKKYGEHIDDHQLQLISQFNELQLICFCLDVKDIGKALECARNMPCNIYKSNTQEMIKHIEKFIEG